MYEGVFNPVSAIHWQSRRPCHNRSLAPYQCQLIRLASLTRIPCRHSAHCTATVNLDSESKLELVVLAANVARSLSFPSRHEPKLSDSQGFPIPADNFPNELAHVCNSVGKSPAWRDSDAAFQVSFSLRYHLACPGISEQIKPLQLVGYSAELRFDSKF